MTSQETQFRASTRAGRSAREVRLRGVAASPGVAIGFAHVIPADALPVVRHGIRPDDVAHERERLMRALAGTRKELLDIRDKLRAVRGGEEAKIFDAHLLMLEDPQTRARAEARIADELLNAEAAFFDVLTDVLRPMEQIEDSYLRERVADIRDVKRRVLTNLGARTSRPFAHVQPNSIVLAHDLSPTVTAELDKDLVLGFATEAGSHTSHTAILARSLEIPAVVGLGLVSELVKQGEPLVLDGGSGLLIRNPSDETIEHYHHVAVAIERKRTRALAVRSLPSESRDGRRFSVQANIETPREVEVAHLFGAEGIGLFRTEFLFMRAGGFPDEEQQFGVYRQIVEGMGGRPVTIRTLDLGGDKMPTDPYAEPETNPFLGWRAIRYSLDHPEIFRAQLRAILRASAHGPVKLMFPLISSVEELRRGREAADRVWRELLEAGVPLGERVPVGAMVETPAAALLADALAAEADFLSIGTNDLIQYTLAVDRGNMRVADLFRPFHPGVLLLVEGTVRAAQAAGIEVALCGEMASSSRAAVLLFGMGLTNFSMIASKIPKVKGALRETTFAEARALWEQCRALRTAREIEDLVTAEFGVRLQQLALARDEIEPTESA
ncbi:MAG TPA: phosphoenolpyruvate--protein phosphotransferase [Gemmatimonadota bacterium]|jgi:phosphotransferase system enzyme I (PtsI)